MKVGITCGGIGPYASGEFIRLSAKAAEDAGFAHYWMPDHVVQFAEYPESVYPYAEGSGQEIPDQDPDAPLQFSDDTYAKFVGNLNIFSYLIRHSDANQGNFLISTIESNPRVYAVDNGIAFASDRSDRGYEWQQLRVERLPAATVARLKMLSPQKIKSALETVAQFEVQYGLPVAVAPTENLAPEKGVRRTDNIIQFGLTRNEIDGIVERLAALLNRVANGKLTLF